MSGQLSMSLPTTCEDLRKPTSSPALADGLTPSVSPDGQTISPSGPALARASRSASPGRDLGQTIQGTCGRTFTGSLPPADRRSSLANRLVERLGMVGSTEFNLIWREKATPAKASIYRLVPLTRRTSAAASTGSQATWPTPRTADGEKNVRTEEGALREIERKGAPQDLMQAVWTTPTTRDWKDTPGMAVTGPDGRVRLDQLPRQVAATWPTPTSLTKSTDEYNGAVNSAGLVAIRNHALAATAPSGPITSGSQEQTEKRGALAPTFPCWLMGYPTIWDDCAPKTMPKRSKK